LRLSFNTCLRYLLPAALMRDVLFQQHTTSHSNGAAISTCGTQKMMAAGTP
jgi:hypothetical protein